MNSLLSEIFFGKKYFKSLFQRLSNLFTSKEISTKNIEWKKNYYLGNDQDLGN